MRRVILALALATAVGCTRSHVPREGSLDASRAGASGQPAIGRDSNLDSDGIPSIESSNHELGKEPKLDEKRLNETIDRLFGARSEYGEDEKAVESFVNGYIDAHHPNFPKKRRCIVRKQGSGWNVEVLDLEIALQGGRDGDIRLRVVKRGGRFTVVDNLR